MPLEFLFSRNSHETFEELQAKRALEKKLGHRVETSELYSLGAYMEATEATPDPTEPPGPTEAATFASSPSVGAPPKPLSKTTKRGLATRGLVFMGAIFLVVAAVVFNYLPEVTRNALNPFAPKPPQGAFPEMIGRYKQKAMSYEDKRSYGYGYEFISLYESPEGESAQYSVIQYNAPADVKPPRNYLITSAKVQESAGRVVAVGDNYLEIFVTAGPRLILIAGRTALALEFEHNLPYSALGLAQRQPENPDEYNVSPIPVVSMLDEFAKDKMAAAKKYGGKTFPFSGTFTQAMTQSNGTLLVGIEKPVTGESKSSSVAAEFSMSEAAALERLKGQQANFKCRVFAFKGTNNFSILENCKLETP